ncbi:MULTISPECIES: hypothetical protein [Halocynthiibacter]|uniref:Uncharacterized protein n=1 Tax=Halocynthiibacter halioticoli TaxID=2986804 RepID=A0AAE3IXW9_9RHOB|nr:MULTISPECIES: hypothetical protein [Halocynthiibacter]MCV6822951.1 hypothetical protein [Halocynthiibacter halioticoli]MCW4055952.1 hypothetical protein [Halocynthiibacter sp. SDUM655004]
MLNALILLVVTIFGALLIWPRVADSRLWRATITPLASIIGSGFLVLGPILDVSYGGYAPIIMIGLCAVAYFFGSAIRYNIHDAETEPAPSKLLVRLETAASGVLAFAFIISVAYYLNLFGAFGVSLTQLNDHFHANLLTSAVFLLILFTGMTRGYTALERMEQVSVGLKLAIIAGLLFGLAVHFGDVANQNALHFDTPRVSGWAGLALMAGLIVTVQGFETSRYLGNTYDAPTRIRSMRLAQWIATGIYCVYIVLLTYAFDTDPNSLNETAIIDMMHVVAPILPLLLVVAALSAQFSAAIADTSGSGGLFAEATNGVVSEKLAYALLAGIGLLLTWTADIFEIISYASRAFALYYSLQATIAAIRAWRNNAKTYAIGFTVMAILGVAATIFGTPVE